MIRFKYHGRLGTLAWPAPLTKQAAGPVAIRPKQPEEAAMKTWRTPKVVEISCGCEINAYFPAEL